MNFILRNRLFIRNLYAQTLMENFMIAAVTTILGIRFYLHMTGYPQIGGAHFHIAHMLYGGLLMMLTIFILFIFLNRTAYNIASITGGVGFGFFIDELGKFITRDNNYFFEPTIALIYVIFILIYLAGELIPKYKSVSKEEYLVNAIELTKEVVIQDLDTAEKKQALAYLKASDQNNLMVPELHKILSGFRSKPGTQDIYSKTKTFIYNQVEKIIQNRKFYFFVVFFIVVQSVISLLITFLIVAALNSFIYFVLAGIVAALSLYLLKSVKFFIRLVYLFLVALVLYVIYALTNYDITISLSFVGWGTVLSTAFAAFVAFLGLIEFNKSRLEALKFFRISILISLFLTQFFLFYSEQFLALIGLAFNILMLLTIEFVISKKETDTGNEVISK